MNDGHVQQQVADFLTNCGRLLHRHTGQHFEFNVVGNTAFLRQLPCAGDCEQVVSRDADVHVLNTVGVHRPIQNSHVVRIRRLLRIPGRQIPAVHRGIDALHCQVCALHDTHLDRCSATRPACCRPFLQILHDVQGVGQIGLKHDAGTQTQAFFTVEDCLEHVDRQLKVVVFLHVQVDELATGADRVLVERKQFAHRMVNDLVVSPRVVRAGHRRNLQ